MSVLFTKHFVGEKTQWNKISVSSQGASVLGGDGLINSSGDKSRGARSIDPQAGGVRPAFPEEVMPKGRPRG